MTQDLRHGAGLGLPTPHLAEASWRIAAAHRSRPPRTVLANVNVEAEFAGHSGCRVFLGRFHEHLFVRKIAGDIHYNARLLQQMEKQHHLFELGLPCPKVLRYGELDGLFFFDMEYIAAVSVAEHIKENTLFDENRLINLLKHWIRVFRSQASYELADETFKKKIETIVTACRTHSWSGNIDAPLMVVVEQLRRQDWRGVPASPGHGDMTLENLLVAKSGEVYFIDFGDSCELSSYMLDLAKLFQDFAGFWCVRKMASTAVPAARLSAEQRLGRFGARMWRTMVEDAPVRPDLFAGLIAFQLLRALPYCLDEETARFIVTRSRHVLETFGEKTGQMDQPISAGSPGQRRELS